MKTLYSEQGKLVRQLKRRLVRSFMDVLILAELKNQPMSGYDTISLIYKKFRFLPSSGSVYSLLYSLERRGLIKGNWDERKRIYELTPKGEEAVRLTLGSYIKLEEFIRSMFLRTE